MRKTSKLLFAGLAAALLMSMAVSTAAANRLSISSQNFRVVWNPLRFIAGGNTVACAVTLDGSFHSRTIAKVLGSLIGYVNRASVAAPEACTGGSATVLTATLPWHVRYAGFTGTLPRLSGVLLDMIGASFQVRPSGSLTCLARSEVNRPARGIVNIESGGVVTGLTADRTFGIPLTGEFGFCGFGGEGVFEGTGVVTAGANTTRVSVRLI
jgi:hypothetical protein